MAEINLDINTLFQRAFGLTRGTPFDSNQINEQGGNIESDGGFDAGNAVSDQEGTEFVNMRNTISAKNKLGQQLFLPVRIGDFLLPNEPTMTITAQKLIVKTGLVGSKRRGSVKELIRQEDYAVTIRGIMINQESRTVYPEDQLKQIHEAFLINESLPVESAITRLLGISRLTLERFSLPEMVGVQHAQAYELVCISDEDFELNID